ncbi:MAG: hypothetical protein WDZ35_10360 [Crocinitomicaceae bacterium]
MKKSKYAVITMAFSLLIMTSCSVVMQKTTAEPRTIEANETRIVIKPLLAEVEVDVTKKITGTATIKGGTPEQAKELAKWDAIEKSGADIIVDPMYKVTTTSTTITAEVIGFFGKYKKISTVEDKDLENLDLYTVPSGGGGEAGKGTVMSRLNKLKKKDE